MGKPVRRFFCMQKYVVKRDALDRDTPKCSIKGLMACPRILAGLQLIPQPPEDGTGQSKML